MRYFKRFARVAKRLIHADGGAALIEFAVVLPILTLLAVGVADLSRLYFASIRLENSAEAGAHYGAQSDATSRNFAGMETAARNDAADPSMSVGAAQFCECPATGSGNCSSPCSTYSDGAAESFVRVTTRYVLNFLVRYPGLPPSVTLSYTATFRVQ